MGEAVIAPVTDLVGVIVRMGDEVNLDFIVGQDIWHFDLLFE